jgi:hypothetical protein
MKKITLFVLSIVALASAAMAQGAMTVNPVDFTSNPAKFNGKTISISDLKLDLVGVVGTTGAVSPTGAIRCNPARGFKSIEVDFSNDPNFSKCFFMSENEYNKLPKGHVLTAQLTFKGTTKLGYTITMFKLQ